MSPYVFPRIIFEGDTALDEFINYISQEGINRILVVTDKTLVKIGLLNELLGKLNEFKVEVFDEVIPEPNLEIIEMGGAVAREFKPEAIIALGGGSVIDAAKGIWIKYENPKFNLEEISPFVKIGVGKKSILVSIPTTSGTGSDVSLGVVYTVIRSGRREKIALGSYELISNIVVLDPRFVANLPKDLTLYTALDALSHAVEALVSNTANELTDSLAIHSIINIFNVLPKLLKDLKNIDLRKRMHLTATMSGMTFSNSGLGLCHGIGHAVGGLFHIHHGRVVGIILPYVVKYNYNSRDAVKKYEYIRKLLVINELASDNPFYIQIRDFIRNLGGNTSLKELIPKKEYMDKINDVIELSLQDPSTIYNPITPSAEDIERLLKDIYEGNL